MPGIIGALPDSGTPFSILTKGTLLRRDLPLITEAARRVDVSVAVSLAVGDPDLHKDVEPGTPSPQARLGLISPIRDPGLDCHVMVAPVLPRVTASGAGGGVPRVIQARRVSAVGLPKHAARQGETADCQTRSGTRSPVLQGGRDSAVTSRRGTPADVVLATSPRRIGPYETWSHM